jgi:hypothetical protein
MRRGEVWWHEPPDEKRWPGRAKGENDLRRFIAGSEDSKYPDISVRLALNSVAAQDSPEA